MASSHPCLITASGKTCCHFVATVVEVFFLCHKFPDTYAAHEDLIGIIFKHTQVYTPVNYVKDYDVYI